MEQIISNLPKPVLALLAIIGAIGFLYLVDPPKTVCDIEVEAQRTALDGFLYAVKTKDKQTFPPVINAQKESCQMGGSAGACLEYFETLKKVISTIQNGTLECRKQLYSVSEVKRSLEDALEVMVRMAWGVTPPQPNLDRFGWFKESELAFFCRLKGAVQMGLGDSGLDQLRLKISQKLPGESDVDLLAAPNEKAQVRTAPQVFSEEEIWNRSVFSVRCDLYGL